jgi:uncharacterized protein YndB with AHSA1/START domain
MTPDPAFDTDREIRHVRVLPASPERVYEAIIDPAQLARWWGPAGFRNTFHEFEPCPGGIWKYTMHGPDCMAYPNEAEFLLLERPARVVLQHLRPMHRFRLELCLNPQAKGTELVWTMSFEAAKDLTGIRDFLHAANEQNLDRLEAHLQGRAAI